MHLRCNYDCMYCPKNRHDHHSDMPTLETLKSYWLQVIKKTKHLEKKYQLFLTGGELTVNNDFLPFIEWLIQNYRDQLYPLSVLSNGSASKNYYLNLFQSVDHLVFSTHTEEMNLSKFVDTAIACNAYSKTIPGKFFMLNIMEEYWAEKEVKYLIDICHENNIKYSISKIIYGQDGSKSAPIINNISRTDLSVTNERISQFGQTIADYIELYTLPEDEFYNAEVVFDDHTTVKTFSSRMRFLDLNHFKGWECYSGYHRMVIGPDSTVYNGECESLVLGKLSDDSFKLLDKPGLCPRNSCTGNPADLATYKRRLDV